MSQNSETVSDVRCKIVLVS